MAVTIAPQLTLRSYSWTNWKTLYAAKKFIYQYDNDSVIYTIWGYDGLDAHATTIWLGTVPDSVIAGGYSQAQNDSDKTDFESNYLAGANGTVDTLPHGLNDAFKKGVAISGQLDDVSIVDATENNIAPVRITAKRAFHINLRNNAGTEVGTSGSPVRVDPTGTTTQPISAASLPLPTNASTLTEQQTQTTALQLIDNLPHAMNAAFNNAVAIGGQLDDAATTAATENNIAPARITAQRAIHTNLRNDSGTEVGTSGAPIRIDPVGTTRQPVELLDVNNEPLGTGRRILTGSEQTVWREEFNTSLSYNAYRWNFTAGPGYSFTIVNGKGTMTRSGTTVTADNEDWFSFRTFRSTIPNHPIKVTVRFSASGVSSSTKMQFGIGRRDLGTSDPYAGAWVELSNSVLTAVECSGLLTGSTTQTTTIATIPSDLNKQHQLTMTIYRDVVEYHLLMQDGTITNKILYKTTAYDITQSTLDAHFGNFFVRARDTANGGSNPTLVINSIIIDEIGTNHDEPTTAALSSYQAARYPDESAYNINHVNSTVPGTASLSNTVASYTKLGGEFIFVPVAGAETDYLLFDFGAARGSFVVNGVSVSAVSTAAASANSQYVMYWMYGIADTVSLASGLHEVYPLGWMTLVASAAIGTGFVPPNINLTLPTPVVCAAGQRFQIILRCVVMAATASQRIRGSVKIDAYNLV